MSDNKAIASTTNDKGISFIEDNKTKSSLIQTAHDKLLVYLKRLGLDEHHIHEKAFYRGYRDFRLGRLDCPYRKDTLLAKEWQRGQNKAYFVNLSKLKDGSLMRNHYNKRNRIATQVQL